jgi:hypothetical protein
MHAEDSSNRRISVIVQYLVKNGVDQLPLPETSKAPASVSDCRKIKFTILRFQLPRGKIE